MIEKYCRFGVFLSRYLFSLELLSQSIGCTTYARKEYCKYEMIHAAVLLMGASLTVDY